MATLKKPKIMLYGAGAIGTTLAAWMTNAGIDVWLYARAKKAKQLRQKKVALSHGSKEIIKPTSLPVIDNLDSIDTFDVIIITVKNFNLEQVCQQLTKKIKPDTLIIGLQNGVVNQTLLPQYFSNVLYGIVNYNAWMIDTTEGNAKSSAPVFNWQVNVNGPIILGRPDNKITAQSRQMIELFSGFIDCIIATNFQDDAHSKLVANLGNAVTTLIGNTHTQASALVPLHYVFTRLTYEGIKTLKAAGFKETSSSPLPSWALIMSSKYIPLLLTRPIFRKKIALIGSTSMATDILFKGTGISELETINGYLLSLADRYNVDVPCSKKLFRLCEAHFSQKPFQPITSHQLKAHLLEHVR